MHNEKYPEDQVSQELVNGTYEVLNGGHLSGRNIKFGDAAGIDPGVMKMQQNIYKFSHAKTFTQLQEINGLLHKDGKKRSWQDFKTEVLRVNENYNVNYLQAEWQTANQAGHHARNWETYQAQRHLFPNLKYKTVGDARVREEHRALEGIIAPIDSDFWKKYYPPNGWRCRCRVVQTAELATHDIKEDYPEIKPQFRVNVGQTEQAYSDGTAEGSKPHNYFVIAKQVGGRALQKAFEETKQYARPIIVKTPKGRAIRVSPFADLQDLEANFKTAQVAVDNIKGLDIAIRHHVDPNILRKVKQPELIINQQPGDRKAIKGYKGISSAFDDLRKKGAVSVAFDLLDFDHWEPEQFVRSIKGKLKAQKTQWAKDIVVVSGGNATVFTGDDVLSRPLEVIEKLKKIKAS